MPNIGDTSIPQIIGIAPLNNLRYGLVNLFKEQNGSAYQLIVGNHDSDSLKSIKTKYTSEKVATAEIIILSDLSDIFIFLPIMY